MGNTGPSYWQAGYPECVKTQQSPIDLPPWMEMTYSADLEPFTFENFDDPSKYNLTLKNNGHTGTIMHYKVKGRYLWQAIVNKHWYFPILQKMIMNFSSSFSGLIHAGLFKELNLIRCMAVAVKMLLCTVKTLKVDKIDRLFL